MSSSPIEAYQSALASHTFIWIVYFRGHWCPFCQAYLKDLQGLIPSINDAGGNVLAVTAEPLEHLAATRKATGFTGDVIVDTEHQLAHELKARGLLDVVVVSNSGYQHGMAHSGVLIQLQDGTVLYHWSQMPSIMNFGGAKDRPLLDKFGTTSKR